MDCYGMLKHTLLTLPLLLLGLPASADEPSIPAAEVGALMSVYMCEQIIETGSLNTDGAVYYDRFGDALLEQYGEAETDIIGQKMTTAFESSSEVAAQDPYVKALFRAVFQNIIDDDACFEAFLAGDVLGDD
jgi:hypothetical protein